MYHSVLLWTTLHKFCPAVCGDIWLCDTLDVSMHLWGTIYLNACWLRCQIIYLTMCVAVCMIVCPSVYFLFWNYLFPNVSVSSSICQINSSDKHMIGQIFKQMVWQIFLSILLMICWTECPILYWMCQTKSLNIFLTVYHNICFSFMLH